MATHAARHLGITIDVPVGRAYAFAHQPENFPRWAAGPSRALHRTEAGWIARTPTGEAIVTFSPANAFGVLDHSVSLPGQVVVHIPLRMVANGDGTEVVFTLLRQPDMDDAMFARDAALVMDDLRRLKALLEAQAA